MKIIAFGVVKLCLKFNQRTISTLHKFQTRFPSQISILFKILELYLEREVYLRMDEKTMVNDILNGVKSELTTYQGVISETENMQLRQTIQQIRNNDESFQYELFKIAETKGYYKPAAKATVTEIDTVKTELQNA